MTAGAPKQYGRTTSNMPFFQYMQDTENPVSVDPYEFSGHKHGWQRQVTSLGENLMYELNEKYYAKFRE